jgi:transposase
LSVGGSAVAPRVFPTFGLVEGPLVGRRDGVLTATVWRRVFDVDRRTVIEGVDFDEDGDVLVARVRPRRREARRCGRCRQRAASYDRGEGRRRWRAPDLGVVRAFVEADAPRVNCRVHGPTVIAVPWARHAAGHTRAFDDVVAWLAVHTSKSAVVELLRIAWVTVGAIVTRVNADLDAAVDRFAGLRRIGIDEIAYKKGHKYLTVVVDHDEGRLVWAAPGRDMATLNGFFDLLGVERSATITHVSADAADWIANVVAARCPNAVLAMDPFHVVAWATDALDEVRRGAWNEARGGRHQRQTAFRRRARPERAHPLKRARWALWKNPAKLTERQRHQLDWVADNHPGVWRGYRLKEGLRYVFAVKGDEGKEALDCWLAWASRSQLAPFIELARRIRRHRAAIDVTLDEGLSNARVESTNTKIRLFTRIAYGFKSTNALIALAMLALGGHPPTLPGRIETHG